MASIPRFTAQTILQPGAVDRANQVVDAVNSLLSLQVKVASAGPSKIQLGSTGQPAVLTISTKDIDLGSITGSKGSNAALASLMAALNSKFTVQDSTT